jgi:hypothetical protein
MNSSRRSSLWLAALAGAVGLFFSSVSAQAEAIAFTNLGADGSFAANRSWGISEGSSPVFEFTAAAGGRLDSISAPVFSWRGTNTVTLTLYSSVSGGLGNPLESISQVWLPTFLSGAQPLTSFVSVQKTELVAGVSYFLMASASGDAQPVWCYNNVGDTGRSLIWPSGNPIPTGPVERAAFSVMVSPVPEPSTYAVLCGVAALGLVVWRRRAKR